MKTNNACPLWSQIDQLISLPSPITYVQTNGDLPAAKTNKTNQSHIIGGKFHQRFWMSHDNIPFLKVEIFHFEVDQIPLVVQTYFLKQDLNGEWQIISEPSSFPSLRWELKECTTQIPAF
jgi:hypothetical protein